MEEPKPHSDLHSYATGRMFYWRCGVVIFALAIAGILLFCRLGHYALWDDEAYTALAGKAILESGDTSAVVGHNIVAFRNGMILENLKDRSTPPLQSGLAAISIALFGYSAFAPRLPFALAGFACVMLMLYWAWRDEADLPALIILAIAIIGNVSLILYSRQSRYYALSMCFAVCIAWLYLHFKGKRRTLLLMSAASVGLLAANYLHFAALYACLAADYLIWGRRRAWLNWRQWTMLLTPIILIGLPIALIWNPTHGSLGEYAQSNSLTQKLSLVWTHLRDMNRCEFGPMALLALAPMLFFWRRDVWLLRASLAMVVTVLVVSFMSPQKLPPGSTARLIDIDADVRYVVILIPLCIALGTLILCQLRGAWRWAGVALASIVFWTNSVNQLSRLDPQISSTLWKYVGELRNPPQDAYRVVSKWINENVIRGNSVWVLPDYMAYPLMYHAPGAVYAWQLTDPPAAQFANLPDIHFVGRVPPDYIIAFGPVVGQLLENFRPALGSYYENVATLDVYWANLTRPELMWRKFETVRAEPQNGTAVYIFKKRKVASAPSVPMPQPSPHPASDFRL